MTRKKSFTQAFFSRGFNTHRHEKRQYSYSNSDLAALCEAKEICGTKSPRVTGTVLALFYESANRLTESKEIENKQKNKKNNTTTKTNWTK